MRALVRTLLGWFSFVFILATRKHQAIHDYLFRTAVVLRHPSALPESERFPERVVPDGFVLPSRLRRASVILLYGATSLVALTVAVEPLISDSCAYYDVCSASEDIILGLLGVVWFALVFAIIVFGCRGQLFGCRRRRSTG